MAMGLTLDTVRFNRWHALRFENPWQEDWYPYHEYLYFNHIALDAMSCFCSELSAFDCISNAYLVGAVAEQLSCGVPIEDLKINDFDFVFLGETHEYRCKIIESFLCKYDGSRVIESVMNGFPMQIRVENLKARKSNTREGGSHYEFEILLTEYGVIIPVGIFVPTEPELDIYRIRTQSPIYRVWGRGFEELLPACEVSLEVFKRSGISDKLAKLLIIIKNASRFNKPINREYILAMMQILIEDLIKNSQFHERHDVKDELIGHFDAYLVPHAECANLELWRTRYWDMLVEYNILEVLFPQTLGRLDSAQLESAKVHFIANGSLMRLRESFL